MHLSLTTFLLISLTSLTSLTTALPTTTPFNLNLLTPKTTCTRLRPPSTPRLNLLNRPDLSLTTTQTLTFTLPPSAPGPCTLRAVFPPHWEIIDTRLQSGGEPLSVNVYAIDGPAAGALVGSVRFADKDRKEWAERVVVVNSFACRERMAYRFELAGVGEVGFVNGFDAGLGVEGGVEMVYGC